MDANISRNIHEFFRSLVPGQQQHAESNEAADEHNDTTSAPSSAPESAVSQVDAQPVASEDVEMRTAEVPPPIDIHGDDDDDDLDSSMPPLQDISDSDSDSYSDDSVSDMDADEVEQHFEGQGASQADDPDLIDLPGLIPMDAPTSASRANRRARVEDDEDEDRDRRHPSQRTNSSTPVNPSTPQMQQPPLPQQLPRRARDGPPTLEAVAARAGQRLGAAGGFGFFQNFLNQGRAPPAANATQNAPNNNSNPNTTNNNVPNLTTQIRVPGNPVPLTFNLDIGIGPFVHRVHGGNGAGNAPPPPPGGAGGAPGRPDLEGDFLSLGDMLARLGTAFGGMMPELHEREDPERAKKLVDGLEEVPIGLVRRLERVGDVGGADDTGGSGGDSGCAICWDRLLDGDGDQFGKEPEKEGDNQPVDDATAPSTAPTDQSGVSEPSETPTDSAPASAAPVEGSSTSEHAHTRPNSPSPASESSQPKIVALPCAHVFHASCLIPWFSRPKQTTCPTCRFNIDPDNLTYTRPRRPAPAPAAEPAPGAAAATPGATATATAPGAPLVAAAADAFAVPQGALFPFFMPIPANLPPAAAAAAATPNPGTAAPAGPDSLESVPPVASTDNSSADVGTQVPRQTDGTAGPIRVDPGEGIASDATAPIGPTPADIVDSVNAALSANDEEFNRVAQEGVQGLEAAARRLMERIMRRAEQVPREQLEDPAAAPPAANPPAANGEQQQSDDATRPPSDARRTLSQAVLSTDSLDQVPTAPASPLGSQPDGPSLVTPQQGLPPNIDPNQPFLGIGFDMVFSVPVGPMLDMDMDMGAEDGLDMMAMDIDMGMNPGDEGSEDEEAEAAEAMAHFQQMMTDQFNQATNQTANGAAPAPPPAPANNPAPHQRTTIGNGFHFMAAGTMNGAVGPLIGFGGGAIPGVLNLPHPLAAGPPAAPASSVDPTAPPAFGDDALPPLIPLDAAPPPTLPANAPGPPTATEGSVGEQAERISQDVFTQRERRRNATPATRNEGGIPTNNGNNANNAPLPGFSQFLRNLSMGLPNNPPPTNRRHSMPMHGPREKRKWTLPSAPGPTLRQRVERKEREAGLRCFDVSCAIGPSDDDPFVDVDAALKKQISIRPPRDASSTERGKAVCEHTFHPSCLVCAQRVALQGAEEVIEGDEAPVTCLVCRTDGVITKEEWEEGASTFA